MRRLLVMFVLLAACASRDGIVDERLIDCGPGQDLSVDVMIDMPEVMSDRATDLVPVVVTVGNNSTRTVEIQGIRVEPGFTAQGRYALEHVYSEVNEVLEAGDDEQFELPVRGQAGTRGLNSPNWPDAPIEVIVTVYLKGGDRYRCRHNVPSPR